MPAWPIAMPSSTAMVLNSLATPPDSLTASATISPTLRRCTWRGTNWVKELAIATIGLPKSSSPMPVARQSARAPAMLRPWVLVRDRRAGIGGSVHRAGLRRSFSHCGLYRSTLVREVDGTPRGPDPVPLTCAYHLGCGEIGA